MLRLIGVVFNVSTYMVMINSGVFSDTAANVMLLLLWWATWAVGITLSTGSLMDYLARVVRSDQHLRALGVGHDKLTERAVNKLKSWKRRMIVPRVFFILNGMLFSVHGHQGLLSGVPPAVKPNCPK